MKLRILDSYSWSKGVKQIILTLIVSVFATVFAGIPLRAQAVGILPLLVAMGIDIGDGAYQNHVFWNDITRSSSPTTTTSCRNAASYARTSSALLGMDPRTHRAWKWSSSTCGTFARTAAKL